MSVWSPNKIGTKNLRVGKLYSFLKLCYNQGVRNSRETVKFSELVRLLERNGFKVVKEKGSVCYYGKEGWRNLIRVDYHGSRELPTGTCNAILKAADLRGKGEE